MIISRCVPVEIARKKFSEFTKPHSPEQVVFVGWKYKDQTKTKKQNVQVHYKHIKQDIIDWIEEHGGLPSDDPIVPSLADVNEVYFHNVTGEALDDNGNKIIDLHHDLGAIEINGGGDYTTDMFYLKNAVVGSITNVVVDNTGIKAEDGTIISATSEFILYYGVSGQGMNQEILRVPAKYRGIAQILHTTDSDIVINANYTEKADYIEDVQQYINTNEDDTGQIQIFTPDKNYYIELVDNGDDTKSYEVDLNQEKGYVEFTPTADYDRYRFYFKRPELGASTFLVIDNTNNANTVTIIYAKNLDPDGTGSITAMEDEVADVAAHEKCVIEVFHSLSTDIVAKVTKV